VLRALESGVDADSAWEELWQELYHQGDVGEASYAAVPHIVRIYRQQGVLDWNPFALVAAIDLARDQGDNPPLPEWLSHSYESAIDQLAHLGLIELSRAAEDITVRCILGILAIWKGSRTHARILTSYTEDEVCELLGDAHSATTTDARS